MKLLYGTVDAYTDKIKINSIGETSLYNFLILNNLLNTLKEFKMNKIKGNKVNLKFLDHKLNKNSFSFVQKRSEVKKRKLLHTNFEHGLERALFQNLFLILL